MTTYLAQFLLIGSSIITAALILGVLSGMVAGIGWLIYTGYTTARCKFRRVT